VADSKSIKRLGQDAIGCFKTRDNDNAILDNPLVSNLTGEKFGKLLALHPVRRREGKRNKSRIYWRCRCDCGNMAVVAASNLAGGKTSSCGCLHLISKNSHVLWKGAGELSGSTFSGIRGDARKRGIPFEITIEYAWNLFQQQQRKCALTGVALTLSEGRGKGSTASLDRIDSKRGYTEGNVQWVHKQLNVMKHLLGLEAFVVVCKAVAKQFAEMKSERSLQEALDSSDRYLQNHLNDAGGK